MPKYKIYVKIDNIESYLGKRHCDSLEEAELLAYDFAREEYNIKYPSAYDDCVNELIENGVITKDTPYHEFSEYADELFNKYINAKASWTIEPVANHEAPIAHYDIYVGLKPPFGSLTYMATMESPYERAMETARAIAIQEYHSLEDNDRVSSWEDIYNDLAATGEEPSEERVNSIYYNEILSLIEYRVEKVIDL